MRRRSIVFALFAGVAVSSPARAALLTFEGLGLAEGTTLTTVLAYPGVTFQNAMLILPGNPNIGFNGNSSGSGAGGVDHANSGATIGYPGNASGTTQLTFASPVTGLELDLADVEVGSVTEIVQVRVYATTSGGSPLQTVTVTGGDPGTGDGVLKHLVLSGFTGDDTIRRLEVQKLAGAAGSNPGIAIDNIRYNDAPTSVVRSSWGDVKRAFGAR